jgi:hypothetical protein
MGTRESHNPLLKDAVLDQLASRANVAQFVSFDPSLRKRFSRLQGDIDPSGIGDAREWVKLALSRSPERSVNVRSFLPTNPKASEFVYGLTTVDDVFGHVSRLAADGLFTIVNETVDVHDGGVSGVVQGDLIEFAPDDTPRAVERPGVASLPRAEGTRLLEVVYGVDPDLSFPPSLRVEFSLHPLRRGVRSSHTLIWEVEEQANPPEAPAFSWPNKFSRLVGDKAYGLMVADLVGLLVPRSTVIARTVAPFSFGIETGTAEVWLRTAPAEQTPGLFSTTRGWTDPYELLAKEDPDANVASVIAQEGVEPMFSGAALLSRADDAIIEGVRGSGEAFMTGAQPPEPLPREVVEGVELVLGQAGSHGFGSLEWVFDGSAVWVLQLHPAVSLGKEKVVIPGPHTREVSFDVSRGLEAFRQFLQGLEKGHDSVLLLGDVGITSHFGDLLRAAGLPSKILPAQRIDADEAQHTPA